jgi:hypothetical protein
VLQNQNNLPENWLRFLWVLGKSSGTKPLSYDSVILLEPQTTLIRVCITAFLGGENTCEVKIFIHQLTCESKSVSCCKPKKLHKKEKVYEALSARSRGDSPNVALKDAAMKN